MAKKDYKDFDMIKYYAKLAKAGKGDIKKDCIITQFAYGDTIFPFSVDFEQKRSTRITYILESVYLKYAKNKYSSYFEFCKAFLAKYDFYDSEVTDSTCFIFTNLKELKIKNTASQALSDLLIMTKCLNEFLGLNEDVFDEKDIRGLQIDYLKSQSKKFAIILGVGLALLALSIFLLIKYNSAFGGILAFLSIIVILVGAVRHRWYRFRINRGVIV